MFSRLFQWFRQRNSVFASALTLLVSLLGGAHYAQTLNHSYPISEWLLWPLLLNCALTGVFFGSLVVGGYAILRRLVPTTELPSSEQALHSLVIGLTLFALSMYAAGALGLYNGWFAALFPLVLFAAGARDIPGFLASARERWAGRKRLSLNAALLTSVALAWGGSMLVLLYLSSITPDNFNFDANWYHIPIAQDYARSGKMVPFYGDNHRAYPHLTSFIHTWALLVPGIKQLPVRWMLMLHLEFGAVIWRLVGAAAVARWCLNGRRIPGLWVFFFLFPSVFIYDQNVAGSADHVLGMTAAPAFLAVARMIKRFDLRFSLLAGLAAGCHILSKYQAIYLVGAIALLVSARLVSLLAQQVLKKQSDPRPRIWHWLKAPLVIAATALLVSSPHFIKNTIYYQNPVYPFASRLFPSSFDDWERPHSSRPERAKRERRLQPTMASPPPLSAVLGHVAAASALTASSQPVGRVESPAQLPFWEQQYSSRKFTFDPQGVGPLARLYWIQRTFIDWSFQAGNRHLTAGRPYMGSLFTLMLPLLFLLRRAKRVWFTAVFCYLCFFVWAATSANDRYLLSFLSVPIGLTAAVLVRAWALGKMARVGVVLLVGLQLFWAGDAPLVYAGERLHGTFKLIKRGYSGQSLEQRLGSYRRGQGLTAAVPRDAIVLGRYFKDHLGFDRSTLNTHQPIQNYINFQLLNHPRDLWQICKDRGVTHLLYPVGKRKPTRLQEIVLFDALVEISPEHKQVSGNLIATLAARPPSSNEPFVVLVKGIKQYQDGLFKVRELSRSDQTKKTKPLSTKKRLDSTNSLQMVHRADAIVLAGPSGMPGLSPEALTREFKLVERFSSTQVWLRKIPEQLE